MVEKDNILVDKFGRVHDYLRISLTERCNLRCFYCMPEEGIALQPRSSFMNKDEIVRIAKIFVDLGVKKIRLTGGEPLVRKDAGEIIRALSSLPIELAITTNGILIDRFIDTFEAAGLRSINISLDSLQREKVNKITRRNFYEKILTNVHAFIQRDFSVKLNAVIMKGENDDELIDFVEFTRENKAHFRFIEFMPFDGNKWDWSKGVSYGDMMKSVYSQYGTAVKRIEDKKNDTSKNYRIDGYKGTFAVISSVTNPFCDTCNRIRITADGKIKNCLFSNSETDLLTPLRDGNDIQELITRSILEKKAVRSGMNTFEELSNPSKHGENRSMIAIGG